MNYRHNKELKNVTKFQEEEYIPIKVIVEDIDLLKHLGFYHENTDLVEFCVDYTSKKLCKLILPFSSNYCFLEASLNLPEADDGEIQLFFPSKTECETFDTLIYNNGVKIKLSKNQSITYIRTGQIYLGFSEKGNLSEILISNLTGSNISFIKNELTLG